MIERIFSFLGKEIRDLHEAAYLLALFAIFSAALALVRDRILAGQFGAGEALDVYYSAFRIPDVLFFTIALSVSVFVLIPQLEKCTNKKEIQKLIGHTLSAFALVMIIVSGVLLIFMPQISAMLFPDLVSGTYGEEFILISRLMLLQPILLGISNILSAITQTQRRYIIYAMAPLLYNSGIIFGALVLTPYFGLRGLVIGVLTGATLHALIQVPFTLRGGFLKSLTLNIDWRLIYKIVSTSFPRTIAMSFNHIAFLVLTTIAATLGAGSISVFQFAFNLHMAPLSIIGASYSVAAFPTLSKLFAEQNMSEFTDSILSACKHIIFWSMPALVLLIVLRAQIVRTVLGSGAFDWTDTMLTAAVLALFAVSIGAQAISLLLVRGYYATRKTFIPFVVNASSAFFMIVMAYSLLHLFESNYMFRFFTEALLRVEGLVGTAILTLVLAYVFASIFNAILLIIFFARDFDVSPRRLSRTALHAFVASIALGFVAYYVLVLLAPFLPTQSTFGIFAQGAIAGLVGLCAWVLTLLILGNKELDEVWRTLRSRFWKKPSIISDIEP